MATPVKKTNKVYGIQVTFDPKHIGPLLNALDLYSRVLMGQLDEVGQVLWSRGGHDDEVKAHFNAIKTRLFPELQGSPNAHLSISNKDVGESGHIAYEILQVIRQADAYARMPEGPRVHGGTVVFDDPLKLSEEPYPRVRALGLLELLADAAQDDPVPGKKKPKKGKKGGKAS